MKAVVSTGVNQLMNEENGKTGYPGPSLLWYLLGISLLHQGTPELILGVGVAVDKLVVECGQAVIYHHIQPLTKTPELEMEDPCIALGFLRIPLLLLPVWDDLQERRRMHPGYSLFC